VIRRHPVGAFLTWFFTVGQAFAFTPVVAREVFHVDILAQPFIVASTVIGLLLPAAVITRIADGPQALGDFWRRTGRVRTSWGWYAVAVVVVPLATAALAVAFFGLPRDVTPAAIAGAAVSGLLVQGFVVLASNNLWEEAAWTGFVQARLQERHGAMRAAVLTAPLFALQHVSLVVGNSPVVGVIFMTAFAVVAIPYRALAGWMYNATGSLFVVGLLHAAGNGMTGGSGFGQGLLPRIYDAEFVGVMHQLANAVLGLVVIAATRGRLGRDRGQRHQRPRRRPAAATPTSASTPAPTPVATATPAPSSTPTPTR
jgi:membrane protease YdiL (CAAX protease family)